MTASANPLGRFSKDSISSNGYANGDTIINGAVPENTVLAFHPNFGTSLDWSPNEQSILEDLLSKYTSDTIIVRYAKIAQQLNDKTVRDVALRCKWMTKKEIGKRRKEEQNSSRKNKDKKVKARDSLPRSSQVANRSNGPPHTQTVLLIDDDDGISYKDIGGATGQLLEQNAHALDQISANFAAFKIQENINLFCQTRNNILTILNEIEVKMSQLPMQMPPFPVKLNEELANSILPQTSMPMPMQMQMQMQPNPS